jgi:hypothetical protein
MTPFESALLTFGLPFVAGLATREIGQLASALIKKLQSSPKTAPLAEGVLAAEDAFDAAVTAAVKDVANPKAIPGDVLKAAGDALKADEVELLTAAKAEVDALTTTTTTTVTTSGGATVNLPKI